MSSRVVPFFAYPVWPLHSAGSPLPFRGPHDWPISMPYHRPGVGKQE